MNKAQAIKLVFPAVERVFNSMFQEEIEQGTVKIKEEAITDQVTVSIGVTGEIQGNILFSFSKEMSLDLVEEMSMMEVNEIDKFVTSAIGELANIISGHTTTALNNEGYQCDIVPPQVIHGDNQFISMEHNEIVIIPIITDNHQFEINIALQNN